MPLDSNGEVTLSWLKGNLCWLCCFLYVFMWMAIASIVSNYDKDAAILVAILGVGSHFVVPMIFFAHERKKCIKQ